MGLFLSSTFLPYACFFSYPFSSISFFVRPEGRFFVPTCRSRVTPRAAAVKDGPVGPPPEAARSVLDGGEHGVTLYPVGTTAILTSGRPWAARRYARRSEGNLRSGGRGSPHNLVCGEPWIGDSTMMQSCASAAGSLAAGPFYKSAHRPGWASAHRHLGSSGRCTGTADGRRTLLCSMKLLLVRLPRPRRSASSGRLEHDALGQLAGRHIAPQRDQQLAGECHDHGLADAAPAVGGARAIPLRQG